MKNPHGIKVGQVVWVEGQEYTVESVGNKYFNLKGYRNRLRLDTLKVDSQYGSPPYAWADKQAYLDHIEYGKLKAKMFRTFSSNYGSLNLTLSQLRRISEIINEPKL